VPIVEFFSLLQYFNRYLVKKGLIVMPKLKREILGNQKDQQIRNKPLLFLILGGFIIIVIALLFAFQKKSVSFTPEVIGQASLKTDKEVVDLGDVKLGQTVNVSFDLKNVGDVPLRFTSRPTIEVKEGC
jgi:hypothetical protein